METLPGSMKGHLRYRILDDLKLILVHYSGVLTIDELVAQINIRNENTAYNPVYNTIYDFRDCIFDFELSDCELFAVEAQKNPIHKIEKKVAILVDKPKETILTTSFIQTVKQYSYNDFEVFYRVGIALHYVNVSLYEMRRIENLFKNKLKTGDGNQGHNYFSKGIV